MPTFCRHNRFLGSCPICSRELADSLPAVRRGPSSRSSSGARSAPARRTAGVRVRRAARALDDGYRCALVPGLKASADADRLADELGFASGRLAELAAAPPGLYGEAAAMAASEREEAIWLCFLVAYLGPVDGDDPFAGARSARVPWSSRAAPALDHVPVGPRGAHDPARGTATVDAYRGWAARTGSQAQAFGGEPGWTRERRFARAFERLALPGLGRAARFDLLVTLGRLDLLDARAGALELGGEDPVTLAAKRVFGIGDRLLLESRARGLAEAGELELEALDLALHNWGAGAERTRAGASSQARDPRAREGARAALGL